MRVVTKGALRAVASHHINSVSYDVLHARERAVSVCLRDAVTLHDAGFVEMSAVLTGIAVALGDEIRRRLAAHRLQASWTDSVRAPEGLGGPPWPESDG